MKNLGVILITMLLTMVVAGCTSPKRAYPALMARDELFPGSTSLSEAEIRRALARPLELPADPTLGLAWIEQYSDAWDVAVPEAERSRLLNDLTQELRGAAFRRAVILPGRPTRNDLGSGSDLLGELRAAAARMGVDAVTAVFTEMNVYEEWNPLAVTYLALVPMFLVPGNSYTVMASAEACIIDVRSGLLVGCGAGHGSASSPLALRLGRDSTLRDLQVAALEDALGELAVPLLEASQQRRTTPPTRAQPPNAGVRLDPPAGRIYSTH